MDFFLGFMCFYAGIVLGAILGEIRELRKLRKKGVYMLWGWIYTAKKIGKETFE
jgi:hypothetical protein